MTYELDLDVYSESACQKYRSQDIQFQGYCPHRHSHTQWSDNSTWPTKVVTNNCNRFWTGSVKTEIILLQDHQERRGWNEAESGYRPWFCCSKLQRSWWTSATAPAHFTRSVSHSSNKLKLNDNSNHLTIINKPSCNKATADNRLALPVHHTW